MDPTNLLCLAIGLGLPVAGLCWAGRYALRPLAAASAYRNTARQLGLAVDTRGVSLSGHLGDRRLWVGEVAQGHGSDRTTDLRAVLDLRPPLGLGLILRTRGRSQRVFRRYRAERAVAGDPWVDRTFSVRSAHGEQIQQLFDADVIAALRHLQGRWPELMVTDHGVQVFPRHPEMSEGGLMGLVESMQRLTRVLGAARAKMEPPADLAAFADEWAAAAGRLGLHFDARLLTLRGELGGHQAAVSPIRHDVGVCADVALRFRSEAGLGLQLRPQLEPSEYWTVGQDIELGDTEFDDAFVIKGWDPQRVSTTFTPAARRALLDLTALGQVHVDDRGLEVRNVDTGAVEAAVRGALEVTQTLGW